MGVRLLKAVGLFLAFVLSFYLLFYIMLLLAFGSDSLPILVNIAFSMPFVFLALGIFFYYRWSRKQAKQAQGIQYRQFFLFLPLLIYELYVFSPAQAYYFGPTSLLIVSYLAGLSIIIEIIFRGTILQILQTDGKYYALLVTSLLFTLLRFLLPMPGAINAMEILLTFLMAVIMGQLAMLLNSLIPGMLWTLLHLINLSQNNFMSQNLYFTIVVIIGLLSYIRYLDHLLSANQAT